MTIRFLSTIEDLTAEQWDELAAGASPMMEWGWLSSLEAGGVATEQGGWLTHHLVFEEPGRGLLAACPLYLREDSEGEYIWNEPFERAALLRGVSLGPRAVIAVPWTPVPGRRILTGGAAAPERGLMLEELAGALLEVARAEGWASVHLLFCTAREERAFVRRGFFARRSCQFQWQNPGGTTFGSFEDFLGSLESSRRTKIRRERKELRAAGVEISWGPGEPADFEDFYESYSATARRNAEPAPPLPRAFFEELAQRFSQRVEFATARCGDELLGRTLNLRGDDGCYYGRYWGAVTPPRFLHFEVALYAGIERCIELGLELFDPGHGGEHKAMRGFGPTAIHSAHWFANQELHELGSGWALQEARWMQQNLLRG